MCNTFTDHEIPRYCLASGHKFLVVTLRSRLIGIGTATVNLEASSP